jgi:ABC-type dipeptide/oligopeptide/nickel transport system permease component
MRCGQVLRYLVYRLLWVIPTLLGMSLVLFTLVHLTPGSPLQPAGAPNPLPPAMLQNLAHTYGLDKPLWQQYLTFVWRASHFDLGPSYTQNTRTVTEVIQSGLPVSMQIGGMALALAIIGGISLGVIAGVNQNGPFDYLTTFTAMLGVALPNFLLAVVLILIFVLGLHWLPHVRGLREPADYVLPVIALGLGPLAIIARYTRSSIIDVIRSDYVRTARAKGLTERRVVLVHVLKNGLIPPITVIGPLLAAVLTGSPFVEYLFGIPGVGRYFLTSIQNQDYPMIMGVFLMYGVFLIFMNLFVDLAYGVVDPRIRYS